MEERDSGFDLPRLRSAALRARALMQRESGFRSAPLDFYLDPRGWSELEAAIRYVSREHPQILAGVAHTDDFAILLLEQLAEGDQVDSITQLLERTEEATRTLGPQLVSVALANIDWRVEPLAVDERTLVVPAVSPQNSENTQSVMKAIEQHFDDSLSPPVLVDPEDPGRLVDSVGCGAAVLSLEEGHREVARHRAVTRARYALACGCLCHSPSDQNKGFTLWPTVGDWLPQPFANHVIETKPHEPGIRSFDRSRPDAAIYQYVRSKPPNDERLLRAPWAAMENATRSHSARALLSTAWQLYIAASMPSHLQRPDRAVHLLAGINALCAPPPGRSGSVDARWERLAASLEVWADLERDGHDVSNMRRSRDRLDAIRNSIVHAAESYNLAYGLRPSSSRGRHVDRGELLPAVVASDLSLLLLAVEAAARSLFLEAQSVAWDLRAFEAHFE